MACGDNADANGLSATAIGSFAEATGNSSTAVGSFSEATGDNSTAIGTSAGFLATGSQNTFVGSASGGSTVGNDNVALGDSAGREITGDGNISIGSGAGNNGPQNINNTISLGRGANATADGAVAIGSGAVATRANQFAFGTSLNTYSMAGITSDASRAAQGAPTHIVTSNATGDLAAYTPAELGLASSADFTGLQSQINGLGRRDSELADGIAVSLALAQPIMLPGQTFAVRGGWGNFDGSNAVGVTAAGVVGRGYWGPTSAVVVDGGVGVSTQENVVAGRSGVTLGW